MQRQGKVNNSQTMGTPSFLAGWAVEAGSPRLDNSLDRSFAAFVFAGLAFAAIDQKVMLEIARITRCLGVIA